jgi:UDP-N-acetyl-2-amino-2-deoxyglucuronate dehydrogenase
MDVRYFPETERFDRHLSKLQRGPEAVDYVSICSPNYLHDAHCRLALRVGADAICEKPLVINPWNLDALEDLERETGHRIYTVMQLRYHPKMVELKERLQNEPTDRTYFVQLVYCTPRGAWYDSSWKGQEEKSGGIATNIGIHCFDLLLWLFGEVEECKTISHCHNDIHGQLRFSKALVNWSLSTNSCWPLPKRFIRVGYEEINFTNGFTDLHTKVYQEILAGRGLGIEDARPAIELAYKMRKGVK